MRRCSRCCASGRRRSTHSARSAASASASSRATAKRSSAALAAQLNGISAGAPATAPAIRSIICLKSRPWGVVRCERIAQGEGSANHPEKDMMTMGLTSRVARSGCVRWRRASLRFSQPRSRSRATQRARALTTLRELPARYATSSCRRISRAERRRHQLRRQRPGQPARRGRKCRRAAIRSISRD